jgi:ribosomal protein S18 acetylase RimI-like enzyme
VEWVKKRCGEFVVTGDGEVRVASTAAGNIRDVDASYGWRGHFGNREVNALHAQAFDHPLRDEDWVGRLRNHSLGWVCARRGDELVGFVNVAWDGGIHAFVLDPIVGRNERGQGIGRQLIRLAADGARRAACIWLHVDFDIDLRHFYYDACGFVPTDAGLIRLRS